jgi:hypothetical protein
MCQKLHDFTFIAIQMLADRKHEEVVEMCFNSLSNYQQGKDLVVINGWRQGGISFNADLASHLDAPVLLSMDLVAEEPPKSVYERAVRSHVSPSQGALATSCSFLGTKVQIVIALKPSHSCSKETALNEPQKNRKPNIVAKMESQIVEAHVVEASKLMTSLKHAQQM